MLDCGGASPFGVAVPFIVGSVHRRWAAFDACQARSKGSGFSQSVDNARRRLARDQLRQQARDTRDASPKS
jgi:hypothetical protein